MFRSPSRPSYTSLVHASMPCFAYVEQLISMQHDYGSQLLRAPTGWGVFWAGSETESFNGHVEGAIVAGKRAVKEVLTSLGRDKA